MEFIANNPFIALCGVLCLWPLFFFGVGWWLRGLIAARGGLPRLSWPGDREL